MLNFLRCGSFYGVWRSIFSFFISPSNWLSLIGQPFLYKSELNSSMYLNLRYLAFQTLSNVPNFTQKISDPKSHSQSITTLLFICIMNIPATYVKESRPRSGCEIRLMPITRINAPRISVKIRAPQPWSLKAETSAITPTNIKDQPANSSAVKDAANGLAKAKIPPKIEATPAMIHKIEYNIIVSFFKLTFRQQFVSKSSVFNPECLQWNFVKPHNHCVKV